MKTVPFKRIEADYAADNSVFSEDTVAIRALGMLPKDERTIIIMYAEDPNIASLARRFNVSRNTMYARLRPIQAKLRIYIARLKRQQL